MGTISQFTPTSKTAILKDSGFFVYNSFFKSLKKSQKLLTNQSFSDNIRVSKDKA